MVKLVATHFCARISATYVWAVTRSTLVK